MTNLDKMLREIEERKWPFDDFPEDLSTWEYQMKEVDKLVKALRCVLERIKDQRCYCEKQKKSGDLYMPKIICFWHDLEQSLEQIMAGEE